MSVSEPINSCIYCGKVGSPLTEEHIIPEGLGGTLTLERASCYDCMDRIGQYESFCLRKTFEAARTYFRVRSKKSHRKRARCLPIGIGESPNVKWVQSDFETYPFAIALPEIAPPALLQGTVKRTPVTVISNVFVWTSPAYLERISAAAKGGTASTFQIFEFGRLEKFFAKIAHGYAVSQLGVAGFEHLATRLIRNEPDELSLSLVGMALTQIAKESPDLHELDIQYFGDLITVRIQLFAPIHTPTFQVVVGRRHSGTGDHVEQAANMGRLGLTIRPLSV